MNDFFLWQLEIDGIIWNDIEPINLTGGRAFRERSSYREDQNHLNHPD
jgi:hypothetical protein